jgi:hypothetical protein
VGAAADAGTAAATAFARALAAAAVARFGPAGELVVE